MNSETEFIIAFRRNSRSTDADDGVSQKFINPPSPLQKDLTYVYGCVCEPGNKALRARGRATTRDNNVLCESEAGVSSHAY